jgi:poly(hydroxyalkanoate) depolymerase family esterase
MKLDEGMMAQMREATRLLQSEGPMAATAAIQRALHGANGSTDTDNAYNGFQTQATPELRDINPPPAADKPAAEQRKGRPDKQARKRAGAASAGEMPNNLQGDMQEKLRKFTDKFKQWDKWTETMARHPVDDVNATESTDLAGKGRFVSASCTNRAGTRAYKLYVPSSHAEGAPGTALPLIVMLHGCTQSANDFAAGTGMNKVAEENNCFVVYPDQIQSANASNCWNWFNSGDQQRDAGEASIIADITRKVMADYPVDPSRVYIAGLSAGGAMAAVMGATYPDLYAAIGVHSGLPYAVAHDMPSAFAAMKSRKMKASPRKTGVKSVKPLGHAMPVIVFHGDRDTTVDPSNGEHVLAQCVPAAYSGTEDQKAPEKGTVPNGRSYTRTTLLDAQGKAVAENWTVHGAGHAWSGGSSKGSYTDSSGPDATREMLRFFLTQRRNTA